MTRLRTVTVVTAALLALLILGRPSRSAPETKQSATLDELVHDLGSTDLDAANAAEKELHRQLTKLSDDLLKIVAAMPKHERGLGEPRYASDRALAVLWTKRNDHGINRFLMMNISQFDNSARSGEGLMAGYPCARVLAQLGPTAAYQIVKHLERPPVGSDLSDRAIDTFASVIVTAFPSGNGGIEEAKAMLTRARRRAKNTEHIDRLNKAVREFFEHKPPPPPHPDAP